MVVEVHGPQVGEEPLHGFGRNPEVLDEQPGEIRPVKGRREVELGVDEPDALQLDDGVGDLLRPVFARRLDHADRKPVQRDVENVAALAREPGGEAAELIMMLQQQNPAAAFRQTVGPGQAGEAAADHDDVIVVVDSFEPVVCHETLQ